MSISRSERERKIASALASVRNGERLSVAARNYNIPKSTLCGRIHGVKSHPEGALSLQKLTPEQDDAVVDWILREERCGRAPSRRAVTSFAESILRAQDDVTPLGTRWLDKFVRRHKEVEGIVKRRRGKHSTGSHEATTTPPRATPARPQENTDLLVRTPTTAKEIEDGVRAYERANGPLGRRVKMIFRQYVRAMAKLSAEKAELQRELAYAKALNEKYGPDKRQNVV